MAFTRENLSIATNHIKAGNVPSLWVYYNEAGDSVISSEFVEERRLTVGDQIAVYQGDYLSPALYRVSAKSTDGTKATLVRTASEFLVAGSYEAITADDFKEVISVKEETSLLTTGASAQTDTFTANASSDYITLSAETPFDGMVIRGSSSDTLPAGISAATDYFAVNSTGKRCQLSATFGGSAIDITDAGTGTHTATLGLGGTASDFFSLPDGIEGQIKVVKVETDGGNQAVVVPTNFADGDYIAFADANDVMKLVFAGNKWNIIEQAGGTVA